MTATRLNGELAAYPVGSIYMSVNATSPSTLFGGTWERITGRFLLAATDGGAAGGNSNASIAAGHTGGEASHTLTGGESGMPQHYHSINQQSVSGGAHTHPVKVRKDNTTGKSAERIGNSSSTETISPIASSGSHSHTLAAHNTNNAGPSNASSAHNNMPPFLAVYVWKRTA